MNSVKNEIKGMNYSMDQVRQLVHEESKNNFDRILKPAQVGFLNGHIVSREDNTRYPMTKYAAKQLATLAGVPGAAFEYLHSTKSPYFTSVIAEAWDRFAESTPKKFMFRLKGNQNGPSKVRAVLSSRYGVIDNQHIIDHLGTALLHHFEHPRFTNVQVGVDGMRLQMRMPLTEEVTLGGKDPHVISLNFANNEVGGGAFHVGADFLRHACLNLSILKSVFGSKSSAVHLGDGTAKLVRCLDGMIANVVDHIPGAYNNYLEKQQILLPNAAEMLRKLAKLHDITKKEAEAIIATDLPLYLAEMGSTAYAVVNSLTAYVKRLEDEERIRHIQTAAGTISQLPASAFVLAGV